MGLFREEEVARGSLKPAGQYLEESHEEGAVKLFTAFLVGGRDVVDMYLCRGGSIWELETFSIRGKLVEQVARDPHPWRGSYFFL